MASSFQSIQRLLIEQRHSPGTFLLPAVALGAIFVPGHMFDWAIEWTWLGAMVVICLIAVLSRPWIGSTLGLNVQFWALSFAVLSGISALSLAIALLREQPINERDIAEMLRMPIYGLMACFFAVRIGSDRFSSMNAVTRLTILYSLACCVVYQLKVPVLYPIVQALYSDAKAAFGAGIIRAPFPFENPNFLAYFLVLALAYFCFLRRSIPFVMLSFVLLFLTGSRSGWIAAAPVIVCFVLVQIISPGIWRKVVSIGSLALALVAIVFYWEQLSSFARVAELIGALQGGDLQNVETARVRLEGAYYMLDWIERSPVLGWGPGRALELDVADNQYLSWIVAWGVAGLVVIIVLGVAIAIRFWNVAVGTLNKLAVIALLSGIALMLATGDFLENYRLFFITFVYLHVFYETLLADHEQTVPSNAASIRAAPLPMTP